MRYVCGKLEAVANCLWACGLIVAITGCGHQAPNAYPQVVEVRFADDRGLCSGTIVSQRAVLTANHCVKGGGKFTVETADGVFETARFETMNQNVNGVHDLAILLFDKEVFRPEAVMALGQVVGSGDAIEIIGFGCRAIRGSAEIPSQRAGRNVVRDVGDFIEVATPTDVATRGAIRNVMGNADNAGACPGDSGGPAATTSESGKLNLVGVTYAYKMGDNEVYSLFVDLTRADNHRFLSDVNQHHALAMVGL